MFSYSDESCFLVKGKHQNFADTNIPNSLLQDPIFMQQL